MAVYIISKGSSIITVIENDGSARYNIVEQICSEHLLNFYRM